MKNRYVLYLALCSALAAGAQNKLDMSANMLVNDLSLIREGVQLADVDQRLRPAILSRGASPMVGAIVELNPGYTIDDITLDGEVETVQQLDELVIVNVSVDDLEKLANLDAVKGVQTGMLRSPKMYYARSASNVDQVHNGEGLEQAYTGAGVVVGLMDTGIDPNHANFLNSDGTETRVKQVYAYSSSSGQPTRSATTPDGIASFDTDNKSEDHGTHVSGIMTGSYRGNANYYIGRKLYEDSPIPFYGVAPDADIVMTGGSLYDANIINGTTKVIEYAEKVNKPAVVNLSLGSIVGPHDGSSYLCKSLASLGKRGIICIASGNEGDIKCAATLSFSRLSKTRTVGLLPPTSSSSGTVAQFWNDTNEAPEAYFVIYDMTTGQEVYTREIPNLSGSAIRIGGSGTSNAYEKDTNFSNAYSSNSYVYISSNVDSSNDRYYIGINMILNRTTSSANNLVAGLKVTNKTSGEVFCTINDGEFTNNDISTWTDGSTIGSLNEMATGDNIIAVGAYTTANSFTTMAGTQYGTGLTKNDIATFTSYGRCNGEERPHICAPGSILVSSINYYNSHSDTSSDVSLRADVKNRANYWGPMQGTSMACPFMSGVAALWLQANPSLTISDIIDIATKTAVKDSYVNGAKTEATRMQWGAGKLDALAGVKEAINYSGISDVTTNPDNTLIVTNKANGIYNIFVANEGAIKATLYAVDGSVAATASSSTSDLDLDASALRGGIYVLSVDGQHSHNTRKLVVK